MIGSNYIKKLTFYPMNPEEKSAVYQTTNSYSTLNQFTSTTKNVWLVFHGIGYLSRYFIKLFESLDSTENYIIAPQAPSKYYKGNTYNKVGSSWLTKENTKVETINVLNYIDAVMQEEDIPENANLIVLGYSQGVSIASRWIASRKISCAAFAIVSGGFPRELGPDDFDFLTPTTEIVHILGEKDPYYEEDKVQVEKNRLERIFPEIQFHIHSGGHELDPNTLSLIL